MELMNEFEGKTPLFVCVQLASSVRVRGKGEGMKNKQTSAQSAGFTS